MGEIASAHVSIYPKISATFGRDLSTQINKQTGTPFGPLEKKSEESGKRSGRKFGDSFGSIAGGVLAGGALVGVLSFVKTSVSAFSELEDATAAAGVVFGDSMSTIIAMSDGAAASMGLSKKQVIDSANTFGTFGKSAGLAGNDLAKFSTQMTGVAADLASFKGGSTEDAIAAVGSALAGEAEPLRRYGVLLDDATLRSRAMKLGLISTTKDALTPQNKVLAAQAEIMAKTTDAQGDFSRTSESTANTQKRLAAESANLTAEIGQKLAPAIVEAQKAGIGMIQWVTRNQAALVPMAQAAGIATAAVLLLVGAVKTFEGVKAANAAVTAFKVAVQGMTTANKVALASAGVLGIALAAGAAIYGLYAQKTDDAKAAVEDYTTALQADSGAIGDNTRLLVANRLVKEGAITAANALGISSGALVNAITDQGVALTDVRSRVLDVIAAYDAGQNGYKNNSGITEEQHKQALLLVNALGDESTGLADAAAGQKAAASATNIATSATKDHTGATKDGSNAQKTYAERLKEVQGLLSKRSARRGLEAAIDAATEAAKKNGKTLDENTPKGRANAQALDDIVTAGMAVGGNMTRARTKFIEVATSMTGSAKEAKKLADKLGLIKSKTVKVKVDIEQGKQDRFVIKYNTQRQGGPKLATGGPIPGTAANDWDDKYPLASGNALGVPGEWVIRRAAVRRYGSAGMAAINSGRAQVRYAGGGEIGGTTGGGGATVTQYISGPDAHQVAALAAAKMQHLLMSQAVQ